MGVQYMTSNVSIKPFIKKFKHNGLFFIYDVNTNQIVEVEKVVYDIIDDYEDKNARLIEAKYKGIYSIPELSSTIERIEDARKKNGLFSNFRPKKVTMGLRRVEAIKEFHSKTGITQMLLEITRACNLKCLYCPTSGKYADTVSGQSHMSKEICLKAVDFFCQRSRHSRDPFISFYGGEPLLKFDLIKETVQYVKKKYDTGKYRFNITTNGTLLDKEIIDFFIDNNFYLMISIDGPEQINDRYRIFRKNGMGTYRTIMRNLEFLRNYNIDYYSQDVSISSVLAPPFDDVDETLNFFSKDKTLSDINARGRIRSNLVDTRGTTFIEDFNLEESIMELKSVNNKFLQRLKRSILGDHLERLTIEKGNPIYSILQNLAKKPIKRLRDFVQPLSACHIGLRRIFVRTNGDFYICERSGDDYKIGCIGTGFDFEKIAGYYRKFEEVLEDCRNCWAVTHCERCWAQVGNPDDFTGKKKEEFCSYNKQMVESAFKVYTELLSKDPDCFKVFEDETKD
jgi:uncharacterized protein